MQKHHAWYNYYDQCGIQKCTVIYIYIYLYFETYSNRCICISDHSVFRHFKQQSCHCNSRAYVSTAVGFYFHSFEC